MMGSFCTEIVERVVSSVENIVDKKYDTKREIAYMGYQAELEMKKLECRTANARTGVIGLAAVGVSAGLAFVAKNVIGNMSQKKIEGKKRKTEEIKDQAYEAESDCQNICGEET